MVNTNAFVRKLLVGFTWSINPSDPRTELGGEFGTLIVTVESEAHGASILGHDGF
jgi:hypothetical protein